MRPLFKLTLVLTVLIFSSCENNTCPDGSVPIEDANGNVIDCFSPPEFGDKNDTSSQSKKFITY